MSLHAAAVEQEHCLKRYNNNALVNLVIQTWDNIDLDKTIAKVVRKLEPILCNVLDANGANNLVEIKRSIKN